MIHLIIPTSTGLWTDSALQQAYSLLSAYTDSYFSDKNLEKPLKMQVLLMEAENYSKLDNTVQQECLSELISYMNSNSTYFTGRRLPQNRFVAVTVQETQEEFLSLFYRMGIKFTLLSEKLGVDFYLGAAEFEQEGDLMLAISHASEALSTLRLIDARRGVCHYSQIDFLKMIGQIHQRDKSIVLSNPCLQNLLNYDRVNGTHYLQTLRVYLSNSCNITQSSRQLFLNRHTMIKRLEKIRNISGLNTDDYYSLLYMSIGLILHDYFIY